MLVFISDVHLTDGTSGTTIVPRAFDKLCRSLSDLVRDPGKSNIKNVEIVLLGDIFDVIRSSLWLRRQNQIAEPVRPWSRTELLDKDGWSLQSYAEAIVNAITTRPDNIESVSYLHAFRDHCAGQGVEVTFSYIIGNHDWLINRYSSTRQAIANFVGLSNAATFADNTFPEYRVFDKYGVLARHGDYYDGFNYEGNRDASSLGDAIVIDLLNRFAVEVTNDPVLGKLKDVVNQLKEIDNVRPLLAMPAWIQGICNEYPGVEQGLHKKWNDLVDSFFDIPFVKDHGHFGIDGLDVLKVAMRLSSSFSFSRLKDLVGNKLVQTLYGSTDDYRRFAYNEAALKNNSAKYVVYGHTHHASQVPLDVIPMGKRGVAEKMYFNTGTWRKVFEQTCFDQDKCEFIGWHVASFVLFYLDSEREKDRCYETWTASLGFSR